MIIGASASPGKHSAREQSGVMLPDDVVEPPLIAVVDDDLSFRTAIGRLLSLWGFRVESFASAEAYLQHPRCAHCLVLDLHLGGMSGLELQARLSDEGRQVPIVFVTATEDSIVRRLALESGAAAFLQKPFDDQRLLEVLYRVMDYRSE